MRFMNQRGEEIHLADNLTLRELTNMGMDVSLTEVTDLEQMAGKPAARRLWDMAEEAKALTYDLAAQAGVPTFRGIAHAARKPAEVAHAHQMAEKQFLIFGGLLFG